MKRKQLDWYDTMYKNWVNSFPLNIKAYCFNYKIRNLYTIMTENIINEET